MKKKDLVPTKSNQMQMVLTDFKWTKVSSQALLIKLLLKFYDIQNCSRHFKNELLTMSTQLFY